MEKIDQSLTQNNPKTERAVLLALEPYKVRRSGGGWRAQCPAHGGDGLNLAIDFKDGKALFCCHSNQCTQADIEKALSLGYHSEPRKLASSPSLVHGRIVAYETRDLGGSLVATQKRRVLPNGKKASPPWWEIGGVKGLGGRKVNTFPLYGSQNINAFDPSRPIDICEGQPATDALAGLLAQALGTYGTSTEPSLEALSWAKGKRFRLWPDNDPPDNRGLLKGLEHMRVMARLFLAAGASEVRILDTSTLPTKGDAVEWLAAQLQNGISKQELRESIKGADVPGLPFLQTSAQRSPRSPKIDKGLLLSEFNRTDAGNGERLAARHGREIRKAYGLGWVVWEGKRWVVDNTGEVSRRALDTVRSLYHEASEIEEKKERELMAGHALKSEALQRIKAMIEMASSQPGIAIDSSAFDAQPWLFNCANGVLDLRTGELLPHNPDFLLSQLSPVRYDPSATCPLWEKFMGEVMLGSAPLVGFLQRATGYTLTGITREEVFFLLHGNRGRNGKAVFMNTLLYLLGDYAKVSQFKTFEKSKEKANTPRGDLVALRGKRLAYASENDEEAQLNEPLIKGITGNDPITARQLQREEVTFTPAFKLWLACNNKPVIKGTNEAIWDRVLFVPWLRYFSKEERDLKLTEKLQKEAPGILAWLVRGCLTWQQQGLNPPQEVKAAVAEYRTEQDSVAQFLAGGLDKADPKDKTLKVKSSELFEWYETFCKSEGIDSLKQKAFSERLVSIGYEKIRERSGIFFAGLSRGELKL